MMHPFMTLDDETEIVHSDADDDGRVEVYIEKPDEKDGFHHMKMFLPDGRVDEVFGFSNKEIHKYENIIASTAHLILEFSREGGLDNAANF